MNITDVSVSNALRAFQIAYDTFLSMTDKKVYTALKNAHTSYFSFEQQGTISRGRLISSENLSKVLAKLAPPNPTVLEREHAQQQHKSTRHSR